MALKTPLDIWAKIILLQELFIGNRKLIHNAFNFYWPQRDKVAIQVMTVVKNDLLHKIVIKHKMNKVNHPYFIFFKIRDLCHQSKWLKKKTRVFNIYDNQIKQRCIWIGNTP